MQGYFERVENDLSIAERSNCEESKASIKIKTVGYDRESGEKI